MLLMRDTWDRRLLSNANFQSNRSPRCSRGALGSHVDGCFRLQFFSSPAAYFFAHFQFLSLSLHEFILIAICPTDCPAWFEVSSWCGPSHHYH